MDALIRFIDQRGGAALARDLGVSRQLVSHWRRGRQRPSPKLARRLEALSGGSVLAADLCPEEFAGMVSVQTECGYE